MIPSRWQRARQVLREQGARGLYFKLLAELGYRRLFLLERSLADPILPMAPRIPLEMDWLEPQQVADYVALRPASDPAALAARWQQGARCLAARSHGRLIGVTWVSRGTAWIGYLKHRLSLASDEAYLFNAYTEPSCRGLAIAPAMSLELLRRLREENCRRVIRATVPENKAALRAHAKVGFRPYAIIRCLKLGPWKVVWQRPLAVSPSSSVRELRHHP